MAAKVNITGAGLANRYYVTINNTDYYSAQSDISSSGAIVVHIAPAASIYGNIIKNGTYVTRNQPISSPDSLSYNITVSSDITDVTIDIAYTAYTVTFTITEATNLPEFSGGGRTLIGGTPYDITAGKCMVGGTAYDITIGKCMVGGSAYDIKTGGSALMPTLAELLADATIVASAGRNSSTTATVSMAASNVPGGTSYMFVFCDGDLAIWRLNGAPSASNYPTRINSSNISTCAFNGTTTLYYRSTTTYSTAGSDTVFGACMVLMTFPYADSVVDEVLGEATITKISGNNSRTRAYVRTRLTTAVTHEIILAGKVGFDAWKPDGDSMTKVIGTETVAANVTSPYITCANSYGASIVALDSAA